MGRRGFVGVDAALLGKQRELLKAAHFLLMTLGHTLAVFETALEADLRFASLLDIWRRVVLALVAFEYF